MVKKEERNYKTYCITVDNPGKGSASTTMPGNMSISRAVERFLQDHLDNDKIRVTIEEHSTEVRVI